MSEQSNGNNRDDKGRFTEGNPGGGRPEGSISALSRLKKEFRENPDKFEEYIDRYMNNPANEKHVMEMLDGKPQQKTDITSGGDKIVFIPSEIATKNDINTSTEGDSEGHSSV